MENVTEAQCVICSAWPIEGREAQRRAHFSGPYGRMPLSGVCELCAAEFWKGIWVVTDSLEELEALRDAVRQERRKGSLRSAHELLRELRAKAPKH